MAGSVGLTTVSAWGTQLARVSLHIVFANHGASTVPALVSHTVMFADLGSLAVPALVLVAPVLAHLAADALLALGAAPTVLADFAFVAAVETVSHGAELANVLVFECTQRLSGGRPGLLEQENVKLGHPEGSHVHVNELAFASFRILTVLPHALGESLGSGADVDEVVDRVGHFVDAAGLVNGGGGHVVWFWYMLCRVVVKGMFLRNVFDAPMMGGGLDCPITRGVGVGRRLLGSAGCLGRAGCSATPATLRFYLVLPPRPPKMGPNKGNEAVMGSATPATPATPNYEVTGEDP